MSICSKHKIFRHWKLEIVLAILVLNDKKKVPSNSPTSISLFALQFVTDSNQQAQQFDTFALHTNLL